MLNTIFNLFYSGRYFLNISTRHYTRGGQTQLWNCLSCPHSRRLSLVTVKRDYAILALRNFKIQAENLYSYYIYETLGQFGNVICNIWSCNSIHYYGVCILIEIECYHCASGTVYSQCFWTSGCPTWMKSVTHQQAECYVVTLLVQAIHYAIWFCKIYIDVSIMDYMCLC